MLEQLKKTIDPEAFQAAWAKGKSLAGSMEDAVITARSMGEKYEFRDR